MRTMKKRKRMKRLLLTVAAAVVLLLVSFGVFYGYWNAASPEKTCASCHEISPSVRTFTSSSHRELACSECHGTALSNGIHSMREKASMVVNHFGDPYQQRIRMNEKQLLEAMNDCKRCHASQYADWLSSGHSATYDDIFLDSLHNSTEQPNADCLRCHGMFFEGTTSELMAPMSRTGPWRMLIAEKSEDPTIPCMACHQIHREGMVSSPPDHSQPGSIFYLRLDTLSELSFYDRVEGAHVSAEFLPVLELRREDERVMVSEDLHTRNCVQCHAPNGFHEAGTSDDRTPRGVHEGIGCTACHATHSNDARQSCQQCHPLISNCNLDVTAMNTTYVNPDSPHNIHWVGCADCHEEIPEASSPNRTIWKTSVN